MTPDEVTSILLKMGIQVSRKTIYNYEKQGLISEPDYRNSRSTDYPQKVVAEFYAAWSLMHGHYGDKDLKKFFASQLPKLSPKAVLAVKNSYRCQQIKASLLLLESENNDAFKQSINLAINKFKSKRKSNQTNNNLLVPKNKFLYSKTEILFVDNKLTDLLKNSSHEATEERIKKIIDVNKMPRAEAVLLEYQDCNKAKEHERIELLKLQKINGNYSANGLEYAFYKIYDNLFNQAIDLLKTL